MTLAEENAWLIRLGKTERESFLTELSHTITILIRLHCASGTNPKESLESIRALNEAHHKLAGYLRDSIAGRVDPHSIDTLSRSFLRDTLPPDILEQMTDAWQRSKMATP